MALRPIDVYRNLRYRLLLQADPIADLFANGEVGVWYDPSDFSTMYQDSAGTTPVTAVADLVGLVVDKSGNGKNAIQATVGLVPHYGYYGTCKFIGFDGADDVLTVTFDSALGTDCTVAYVGLDEAPVILTGQTIGTSYNITASRAGIIIIDRALTAEETTLVTDYLTGKVTVYDYYVDSVTGSDLDTGLTPALAFATIDGLPTLVDGVKVGFAAGSTFPETLTVTGAPNMVLNGFGDFGASGQPVLDGAGAVAETWVQDDAITYPNTWNIDVTHGFAVTSGRLMIWEDGSMLKRVASIALCNAEAGTYYSPNDNNFTIPTVKVYAHATGSGNPNSNGKSYERTKRSYVVNGGYGLGIGNSAQNIVTGRQGHNDGSLVLGKSSIVDRCMAYDGHKHNALQESGYCRNSAFINAQPESNYLHVFYTTVATGLNASYDNTVFVGQTNGLLGTSGIYCHDNSGQSHDLMSINSCMFANVNSGIGSTAVATSAQGVYMENVYQPITIVSSTTSTFSHFLINGQKLGFSVDAAGTHSISQFASYITADYSFFRPTTNFGTVTISNSTVVLNGGAVNMRTTMRRTGGVGTLSWQNNIFAGIGVDANLIQTIITTTANIGSINNNVYYTDSSFGKACLRWTVDGVNKTFAEWQALGHDTNSIVLDETDILLADLFPGGIANGDFRLASGLSFALPDATPISSLGVTEHWNFSTKSVVAGAPERWVTMPKTKAQGEAFIKDPTGWSF